MKSKHKKAIMCLVDTTEAILDVFEKHKIDPDKVAEHYEFKLLVHLLKTIIDGQSGIPNSLHEKLKDLDLDKTPSHTVH